MSNPIKISRKIAAFAAPMLLGFVLSVSSAFGGENLHGHSLVGGLKYPKGFARFDYVNPEAPLGGEVKLAYNTTFDSFNFFVSQGTTPRLLSAIYDTLMTTALDEISSHYGLIAESMSFPDDFSSVTFKLRPEARFHDGMPVTADDVIFSFEQITKLNPLYTYYYHNVSGVEKLGTHEVKFTFDVTGNRELPHILGQLTILPKHHWTGKNAEGEARDISQVTLDPPLSSGAYRVGEFEPGRFITYERVEDYWAKDLNVNVGRNNFDKITVRFYLDENAVFDALKLGQADWRTESTARRWVKEYDFPAIEAGKVVKETFPINDQGLMNGFVFNLRRKPFQDERVRRAFNQVFNFEEANKGLFYGQYHRINSYFFPTELASSGLPEGQELAILEEVRDQVPPSVFTEVYTNPVFEGPKDERKAQRKALKLLKEAGWTLKEGKLVDGEGNPFTLEILLNGSTYEPISLAYKESLTAIGMDVSIRVVDPSQYLERTNARDYDVIFTAWAQSLSTGNEQLEYWGSESADKEGSKNYIGIQDPAIDHLIQKVILAKDRQELLAANRAMDRVLLHHHYLVPLWASLDTRTARWDRFGRPETLPEYTHGFPFIWWLDPQKAEKAKP